jgi:hypothetical protein
MMNLIAPSLEDVGIVLFGLDWREPLANALGVSLEDVVAWENDPTTIPVRIDAELHRIGMTRRQEIQIMLFQIKEPGINRSAPDDEGNGIQG